MIWIMIAVEFVFSEIQGEAHESGDTLLSLLLKKQNKNNNGPFSSQTCTKVAKNTGSKSQAILFAWKR